jgi:hypothetical protein
MRTLTFLALLTSLCAPLYSQLHPVDFRYAPASWFTAICFPGDWQKSVITHNGALGDDFAPGPYARPLTEISFGIKGQSLQPDTIRLESALVPVPRITLGKNGSTINQTIFAVTPSGTQTPASLFLGGRLERLGALTGTPAWASPPPGVDDAFRGVAWGVNRPVKYRVRVAPGSSHTVVLGLCEPYKPASGKRIMLLRVEGAGDVIADPVRDERQNVPYVYTFAGRDIDYNGWLTIEAHAAMESPDPNVILNAIWVFKKGFSPDPEALIHGRQTAAAELYWRCGTELDAQPGLLREDALLATFSVDTTTPVLVIRTRRTLEFDSTTGAVYSAGRLYLRCSPPPLSCEQTRDSVVLTFAKGTAEIAAVVAHGAGTSGSQHTPASLRAALDSVRTYWIHNSGLPFGRITIPDSSMQNLLDASIRNLYAIAENADGAPQFQPGPSVYRGLWVHDAIWQTTAAVYLGDTSGARTRIESLFRYQKPDGQFEVMAPYPMNRETPIALTLACRYARLTNNRGWLERYWHVVQRGNRWLWDLRQGTLNDPGSPSCGLFPAGFSDGGLGGVTPEYGSVYWGLVGLASTASAARWLGHDDDAARWESQYRDLLGSFRNAAARDQRVDQFGNPYLPMKVGDTSTTSSPQTANWGIIDAQGVGNIFSVDDSLVVGSLRMLRGVTVEGLPPSTGWLRDGLWPFFGTLEAIAHIYQREDSIATELLYAVANHASPTWTWIEEQLPRSMGTRTSGDCSNATASALFIKLIRRMILLERDSTMEMLAAVPAEWYFPGAHLEVKGIPTLFGRCTFRLDVAKDDSRATIIVNPMVEGSIHGTVALQLSNLRRAGFTARQGKAASETLRFPSDRGVRLVLTRP